MDKSKPAREQSDRPRLTLDALATYQIQVPGHPEASWGGWAGPMTLTAETDAGGRPVTTLTGAVDQAALMGLLRRLNSLGLPLLSVRCLDVIGSPL